MSRDEPRGVGVRDTWPVATCCGLPTLRRDEERGVVKPRQLQLPPSRSC